MKIKQEDLEQEVQNKLSKLDNIIDKTGYLYASNGVIDIKNINDISLKKVYTTDDIYSLNDHLYKSSNNYISGFDKSLLLSNDARATSKLLNTLIPNKLLVNQYKIIKYFNSDNYIYLLNNAGNLYCINNTTFQYNALNILKILKEKFITTQLFPHDISYITNYDDDILVSIKKYGIFMFKLDGSCECISREINVDKLLKLSNSNIVCIRKNTLYDNLFILNTDGRKIISYNTLSKINNYVLDVIVDSNAFYVIGDTLGALHSESIIFKFDLDIACIAFNYIETGYRNYLDSSYLMYKSKLYNHNIYTLTVHNNKICLWKYNNEFNSFESYSYDIDINYDDILDFNIINNELVVLTKSRLFYFNKTSMIHNYNIDVSYSNSIITNTNIYIFDDLTLYEIKKPECKNYSILTLNLSALKNINNVDVYIKSNTKLVCKFYDHLTNTEVTPVFGMYINSTDSIYKIYNNTAELYLQIQGITADTIIDGVVLHANNIYYK